MTARRRQLGVRSLAAVAVLVAGGSLGVVATSSAATVAKDRDQREAATVGALFASATARQHYCTASVVDSPAGDLLLTAAHCISGTGAGATFVPDDQDGHEPYGAWSVVAAYAAPAWVSGADPQDDVAFLVVAPKTVHGKKVEIEDVTGANALGAAPAAGQAVTVIGYPAGSDDKAITCTAPVYLHDGYPAFNCAGFVGGTSGGPWIVDTKYGDEVVGVIGGLYQGGCYAATSYSAVFASATEEAYALAVQDTAPATLPAAGPSGCAPSS